MKAVHRDLHAYHRRLYQWYGLKAVTSPFRACNRASYGFFGTCVRLGAWGGQSGWKMTQICENRMLGGGRWWTPGDAAKDLSELESMFAQA